MTDHDPILQEVARFVERNHPLPQGRHVLDGVEFVHTIRRNRIHWAIGFFAPDGSSVAVYRYALIGLNNPQPGSFARAVDLETVSAGDDDLAGVFMKLLIANRESPSE